MAIDLLVQDNELIGTYSWIAYRIGGLPQLVQPVSVVSTPALNLLLHVVNAAIALAVLALLDRRRPHLADVPVPRRVLAWSLGVPAAVCVAWVAWSLLIFTSVTHRMGPEVRVAAVQPGLDNATPGTLISAGDLHPGRGEEQRRTAQIAELSDMTRQAAARGARIVVWPEETLNYDPRVIDTAWIPALVRQTGVYLAMGFTPNATDGSAPNTALLWSPDGSVASVYYKTKRVLAEGESFTPGTAYPTVETPYGTVGIIICFDIDFPDGPARRVAANGARMILAPSIDFASVADARSASTAYRAIENRVAMVKADVAWDSVIVAPNGRVITSSGADNAVKVWDWIKGERRKNLEGWDKEVTSVHHLGATTRLVTTSGDKQVRLIGEDASAPAVLPGTKDFMQCSAVSLDGGTIVAAGEDSVLRVWDAKTAKEIAAFARP